MAKLDPKTGLFKGVIGNHTLYIADGEQFLKSKGRKPYHPNTEKQVNSKTKFGGVARYTSNIKSLMTSIWNPAAKANKGHGLFIHENHHCFNNQGNLVKPCELLISYGILELPETIELHQFDEDHHHVLVTWKENQKSASFVNQQFKYLLTCNDHFTFSENLICSRKVAQYKISIPENYSGQIYLYCYFNDTSNGLYSDSICLSFNI